jgi:ferrous iron transport protein A
MVPLKVRGAPMNYVDIFGTKRGWQGGFFPREGIRPLAPPTIYPYLEEGTMILERTPPGTVARIITIIAGMNAMSRAFQMGLAPGTVIEVVENNLAYPWTPVIVRVHGMLVAVGRGLASRIIVKPIEKKEETGKSQKPT